MEDREGQIQAQQESRHFLHLDIRAILVDTSGGTCTECQTYSGQQCINGKNIKEEHVSIRMSGPSWVTAAAGAHASFKRQAREGKPMSLSQTASPPHHTTPVRSLFHSRVLELKCVQHSTSPSPPRPAVPPLLPRSLALLLRAVQRSAKVHQRGCAHAFDHALPLRLHRRLGDPPEGLTAIATDRSGRMGRVGGSGRSSSGSSSSSSISRNRGRVSRNRRRPSACVGFACTDSLRFA